MIVYLLLGFCALATVVHVATVAVTMLRCRRAKVSSASKHTPAVTLIRPVSGLDAVEAATLASSFQLATPHVEIIFCCATPTDPAVPVLRKLIADSNGVDARLLIGQERASANPKLDNILKGWWAARHDWIIWADSNLLLPPDYVARVMGAWTRDTGLVCAPPIGASPASFWAEVECAFLNTYQARWQYAADQFGFGFAQGKTMLWRRAELEAWGGLKALRCEVAEDAAATKIVRQAGRKVRLAGPSFEQPLGHRTLAQVWSRQLRWAQLRRLAFPAYFVPEVLTGSIPPLLAAALAWGMLDTLPAWPLGLGAIVWFGSEAALARVAGWHLRWFSPLSWILRDLMISGVWLSAWFVRSYEWRGNTVSSVSSSGREGLVGAPGSR